MQAVLSEHLTGKVYANEDVDDLTKTIALQVRDRVRGTLSILLS